MLFLFIFILSLILGILIYRFPLQVIRLQQQFYARINWRMEPISMDKEIRNTRLMGFFLLMATLFIGIGVNLSSP